MSTIHTLAAVNASPAITNVRRSIWRRWHNPRSVSMPVFLIGCGRSGTNMVTRRLARSWQVDFYNEDHPAAFENYLLRDLSTLRGLVDKSHADVVLFKSILENHRANALLSSFPGSRVLFLVRHYDDVINSAEKRFGRTHWASQVESWITTDFSAFLPEGLPAETTSFIKSRWSSSLDPASGAALYWLFQNRLFFDLGLHRDPRARLLKYESIVAEPQTNYAETCTFLRINYQPRMVERVSSSSVKRNAPPTLDEQIRTDCQMLWERLSRHADDRTN